MSESVSENPNASGVGSMELLERNRRPKDIDLTVLKACIKALDKSTSRQMLEANLVFLWDRYLRHPSETLPEHLRS